MTAAAERVFVDRVARAAVSAHAPDELPLFDPVSAAYHRDPRRVLSDRKRADETLGAGIDTVITYLTPVALAVGSAAYQHLVTKAGDGIVDRGGKWLGGLFRFRKKRAGATIAAPLTEDQLAALDKVARRRAVELGLSDAGAAKLAESLRDSLGE
jgi:hypothetical protein